MSIYYTGIGARKTPKKILKLMKKVGFYMASKNIILRSGGAIGADSAFQDGCQKWCNKYDTPYKDKQLIILPWNKFNNNISNVENGITLENHWLSYDITCETHPRAKYLTRTQMKLMERNVTQVYGYGQMDSELIICWTKDGAYKKTTSESGGTGQAIRLANESNIPIYNLQNKIHRKKIKKLIGINK